MVTLTKESAIKAVRKNLDEQEWNPSAMYGESVDNFELDRIIEKTIPEAIDAVNLAAPVTALEAVETSFVEEGAKDGVVSFRTGEPVLRIVGMRAVDSEIELTEAIPESSAEGRRQLNKYVRGTYDNPVMVLQNGSRNRFKYYSVGSQAVNRARRIADYLYEYSVDHLDYAFADDYFRNRSPYAPAGACSSVRSGNYYGRNFDWYYNEDVEFVVRTEAKDGRHATMGVAASVPGLTREEVEQGANQDAYKILPFYLLDGVNDAGVFCNMNVVTADYGPTTVVPAQDDDNPDVICTLMLVRYILDNFSSALDALNYIQDHVTLYNPQSLIDKNFDLHFMVGDATSTYVLEIIDGEVEFEEHDIMTNFYLHGVEFSGGEFVYTIADNPTHSPYDDCHITLYGSGLERYNYIANDLDIADTKAGMRQVMNGVLYSQAYLSAPNVANPIWHSEFVGDNLTVRSEASAFTAREVKYAEYFSKRDRKNPLTWHTAHSCVYDLVSKRLFLVSQEDTAHEYEFRFNEQVPGSYIDHVEYITFARPSDEYELSTALLKPLYDQLTAMVLAIYGETEKANYFFQKATIQ